MTNKSKLPQDEAQVFYLYGVIGTTDVIYTFFIYIFTAIIHYIYQYITICLQKNKQVYTVTCLLNNYDVNICTSIHRHHFLLLLLSERHFLYYSLSQGIKKRHRKKDIISHLTQRIINGKLNESGFRPLVCTYRQN